MIGLNIVDIKDFMTGIFKGSMFDKFYLKDAQIQTFTDFRFGGPLNQAYYGSEEFEALEGRRYPYWSEIRPFAFQIIRGDHLPLKFKLVFQLSDENTRWLFDKHQIPIPMEDLAGLFVNVSYDQQKVLCTSGISYKTFLMDRTLEQCWDDTVCQYFKQNHIAFEKL